MKSAFQPQSKVTPSTMHLKGHLANSIHLRPSCLSMQHWLYTYLLKPPSRPASPLPYFLLASTSYNSLPPSILIPTLLHSSPFHSLPPLSQPVSNTLPFPFHDEPNDELSHRPCSTPLPPVRSHGYPQTHLSPIHFYYQNRARRLKPRRGYWIWVLKKWCYLHRQNVQIKRGRVPKNHVYIFCVFVVV
jgi:hypothetical protein